MNSDNVITREKNIYLFIRCWAAVCPWLEGTTKLRLDWPERQGVDLANNPPPPRKKTNSSIFTWISVKEPSQLSVNTSISNMQRFCSSTLNEHVCFQIKRKQVFKQLLEVLPRMIGRKKKKGGGAIFVPHLFQTWMLQMMTQICAVRYYWYSSHRFSANWLQAGQGGGGERGL